MKIYIKWPVIVSIFLFTFLVYANSIHSPFHYDDHHHILENPHIRKVSNIPKFFVEPSMFSALASRMYRPLLMASYALNFYLGGNNPTGYNLVNVSLHAINSIFVFLIISFLLRSVKEYKQEKGDIYILPAFFGGSLYAVNPINSEAVNYISSRSNLMATTFYLMAFYLYMKLEVECKGQEARNQKSDSGSKNSLASNLWPLVSGYYLLALLSYLLGLLTKEIAITLPLILLMYDYFLRERSEVIGRETGGTTGHSRFTVHHSLFTIHGLIRHLPFWIITSLYLLLRKAVMGSTGLGVAFAKAKAIDAVKVIDVGITEGVSRATLYQLTQLKVILHYLKLWFFPLNLNVNYAYPLIDSLNDPFLWLSIVMLLLILSFLILAHKNHRLITFFSLWFFITLLPTSLVPLNVVMAENRIYLPGIGITVVIVSVFTKFLESKIISYPGRMVLFTIFIFSLLTFYSAGTIARNIVWKSEVTLWRDAAAKSPRSAKSYHNLGEAYLSEGETDRAIDSYLIAISLNSQDSRTYNALGIAYNRKGLSTEAIKAFQQAIEKLPEMPESFNNLGSIYYNMGRYKEAIDLYENALSIRPVFSQAYTNLGNVYWVLGDYGRAMENYEKALEIDPQDRTAREYLRKLQGISN